MSTQGRLIFSFRKRWLL